MKLFNIEMMTKRKWDNYRFTSRWELHIYSLWARLSPYLSRLICQCDWRSCRNWGGILDTLRKFHRKILGCAGLLIGCHSIPLRSNHDHDFVALFGTLGFQCECLLFPTDIELYGPNYNINHGSGGTQEQSPQAQKNSWSSLGYLPWFPLDTGSIDPLAADAGK
jgi:hypothetical protein